MPTFALQVVIRDVQTKVSMHISKVKCGKSKYTISTRVKHSCVTTVNPI